MENLSNELIDRINKARQEINENGGNNAFYNFVKAEKGVYSGFSRSNVSYILSAIKNAGDEISLKNLEEKVIEFEKTVADFVDFNNDFRKRFFNRNWYLYFFYSRPKAVIRAMLARIVLSIDENGIVNVKNVDDGISTNYHGSFELVNETVIFFELKSGGRESKVHLKIITGEKPKRISLGMYISYEFQSVFAGTAVLELQDQDLDYLQPKLFDKQDSDFLNINSNIRKYLSLKSQNLLKIPNEVFTFDQLEDFIMGYQKDKRGMFYDFDVPKVFISSPTDSIDPEYHNVKSKEITSIINNVQNRLMENKITVEFYYPGEKNEKEQEGDYLSHHRRLLIDNMEYLKRTKFFILIYDIRSVSKSLIELGWALANCKVVLVLYKSSEGFPESLSALEYSNRLRLFKMERFQSLTDQNDKQFIENKIFYTIVENISNLGYAPY